MHCPDRSRHRRSDKPATPGARSRLVTEGAAVRPARRATQMIEWAWEILDPAITLSRSPLQQPLAASAGIQFGAVTRRNRYIISRWVI